jgi:hypothetical protein
MSKIETQPANFIRFKADEMIITDKRICAVSKEVFIAVKAFDRRIGEGQNFDLFETYDRLREFLEDTFNGGEQLHRVGFGGRTIPIDVEDFLEYHPENCIKHFAAWCLNTAEKA